MKVDETYNSNSNFYEHVQDNRFDEDKKKGKSKLEGKGVKKNCLRCDILFKTRAKGNRFCGSCAAINSRASVRAGQIMDRKA